MNLTRVVEDGGDEEWDCKDSGVWSNPGVIVHLQRELSSKKEEEFI